MIISINGENIDYTLENEKLTSEVVQGVSHWLKESGIFVGSITINKVPVSLNGQDWRDRSLDDIQILAFETISQRELCAQQWEQVRDYVLQLCDTAQNGDKKSFQNLVKEYKNGKKISPLYFADKGSPPHFLPQLDAILTETGFSDILHSPENNADALKDKKDFFALFFKNHLQEILLPEEKSLSVANNLGEMAKNLSDVAVQLQTGKDNLALSTIIHLSDHMQSLLRCLSWMPEKDGVKNLINELYANLNELENALKTNDTVLIGDLLEYEIKPKLLRLPDHLKPQRTSAP